MNILTIQSKFTRAFFLKQADEGPGRPPRRRARPAKPATAKK